MRAPVIIVDYDPRWPRFFDEEKANIIRVIGPMVVGIEHIGSTAVPGLAAKAIIDILVGVQQLSNATWCIQPLKTLRYEYVPELEKFLPDRRYFRKGNVQGSEQGSTHHMHMVEAGGDFWGRQLLFRDYLRDHPEEARHYADLKKTLAARFSADRESYTSAKTDYIQEIVARAKAGR
jgi:GrpB-like predicted nucleotidyltransferase (UPF0157 family)